MADNTTNEKREKRAYTYKRLRTQDELWKAIVPALWIPFIRFCMEDWADKIFIFLLQIQKKNLFLSVKLNHSLIKTTIWKH